MNTTTTARRIGACRTTATAFGVLAGLGGITHGVGEVLQGYVPVEDFWLESWTSGPIAEHMGGEPGITVLPTAFSAGLVTLVLAGAVVAWSLVGLRRGHGARYSSCCRSGCCWPAAGSVPRSSVSSLARWHAGALTADPAGSSDCPLASVEVWRVPGPACSPWR